MVWSEARSLRLVRSCGCQHEQTHQLDVPGKERPRCQRRGIILPQAAHIHTGMQITLEFVGFV